MKSRNPDEIRNLIRNLSDFEISYAKPARYWPLGKTGTRLLFITTSANLTSDPLPKPYLVSNHTLCGIIFCLGLGLESSFVRLLWFNYVVVLDRATHFPYCWVVL